MKLYGPENFFLGKLSSMFRGVYYIQAICTNFGEFWKFVVFKILVNLIWIVEFMCIELFILFHHFFWSLQVCKRFYFYSQYLCVSSLSSFHCLMFFHFIDPLKNSFFSLILLIFFLVFCFYFYFYLIRPSAFFFSSFPRFLRWKLKLLFSKHFFLI